MLAVAVRMCASAGVGQWVAWFMLASFAAPFAVYVVRASREDIKKGAILGLTMILLLVVLVTQADAIPIMDPCETCRRLWGEWCGYLPGCW